jgi:hypothetical protein
MTKSILQLRPYYAEDKWVFDDPSVDLWREPFVGVTNQLIDRLVVDSGLDLASARRGFLLTFGSSTFQGATHHFEWVGAGEGSGDYYALTEVYEKGEWRDHTSVEGWLCPSLLKYFEAAPGSLYAKASRDRVRRGFK